MDEIGLRRLLRLQDGVVSRRQLEELGCVKHDRARLLRRRELSRVHPGVYVTHTGPLTDRQRAWAAVLYAAPAALCLESALDPSVEPVRVAIDWGRRVASRPGVEVHCVRGLDRRVRWNLAPPRMQVEHAVLDLTD